MFSSPARFVPSLSRTVLFVLCDLLFPPHRYVSLRCRRSSWPSLSSSRCRSSRAVTPPIHLSRPLRAAVCTLSEPLSAPSPGPSVWDIPPPTAPSTVSKHRQSSSHGQKPTQAHVAPLIRRLYSLIREIQGGPCCGDCASLMGRPVPAWREPTRLMT